MRTMSSILTFTFWFLLTSCASAGPVLGEGPGSASALSAPEAPRPSIAQVLAAADPLQVNVEPTAPQTKESGQDHSGHQGHSGHKGQHTQPAPPSPQETPVHDNHEGHGSPKKHTGQGAPEAGEQGSHVHPKH